MTIKRKFNMFSTREWILYLQYKLSPDREKELNLRADEDDFLREAIEIIGEKENRPLAYQSISQLIDVIQENTGVSESKILKVKSENTEVKSESSLNLKLILGSIGAIVLLGLLGYGIYYFSSKYDFAADDIEEPMIEAEAVSETQLYADSSTMPMETLPSVQSTNISSENEVSRSSESTPAIQQVHREPPKDSRNTNSAVERSAQNNTTESSTEVSKPNNQNSNAPSISKERELFNKAQDLYKGGDRDGAKKILKDLKSYENPMQSKAESILKNMEN